MKNNQLFQQPTTHCFICISFVKVITNIVLRQKIINSVQTLTVLKVCKIVVCEKSHSLNEQRVCGRGVICNPLSVAFVSVLCTRCAVFLTPQHCFRRLIACACDHTPNIISTALSCTCNIKPKTLTIPLHLHHWVYLHQHWEIFFS